MNILVAGAGQVGRLLAQLLAHREATQVVLVDTLLANLANIPPSASLTMVKFDVTQSDQLKSLMRDHAIQAVVSCLPYFCNRSIAQIAAELGIHYFDLTEDVDTVTLVKQYAQGHQVAFVPRCGVAPGFINILAHDLMLAFDTLDSVRLRAGCLPKYVSNSLHYTLSWSVDGLINQYGNPCEGIVEGKRVELRPLEDMETIQLDGIEYEAFNTSGGVGELANMYVGKVDKLEYKTIRYPGHGERMRFLMQDLFLNEDRDTLKRILVRALPKTDDDVMLVFVSVTGQLHGELVEKSTLKRIVPHRIYDQHWSGIQTATASSAAVVIDMVLSNPAQFHGFILQESLSYQQFMASAFASVFSN